MIVEPRVKGFICTTAHKGGCEENVRRQIKYIENNGKVEGAKKVLIIGASTGYGLASRITAGFGCDAATIGVSFERESHGKRTATPGWYNTKAYEKFAREKGLYAKSINGDAFTDDIKRQTLQLIKEDLGKIDMVIYSLAAPRRTMENGITYHSVLKTSNQDFTNKSWNLSNNKIGEATILKASKDEIDATIKVMGGEDWKNWIDLLMEEDALEKDAITIAYSYIGPELTYPVYKDGTIGKAKEDLYQTAKFLNEKYQKEGLNAIISVNKALVTQASSAIPIVPLYFAILYKIMKEKEIHEGCIEQMARLFKDRLYGNEINIRDACNRIRMDDWEMREDVQNEVVQIWERINSDNIFLLADVNGYWEDFYHMFGFRYDTIDYSLDV